MATKEQCIQSAMAGGLSREDAAAAVDALLKDATRINRAAAEGKIVNANKALADAWANRMDLEAAAAANAKRQAGINVLKRQQLDARIASVKEAGFTGLDAVEAILVGSNKRFLGARTSVDAKRVGIFKDAVGGMLNDLEKLDPTMVRELNQSTEFNRNVIREIINPESTGDAKARQTADVFSRHMEKSRRRLNDAGADIGRLDGYVPQSHDPWKVTKPRKDGKNAREAWLDMAIQTYDIERSFPEIAADAVEVRRVLNDIYDNITLGKGTGPGALNDGAPAGPRNIASGMGKHRVIHFKDADAFMKYNAEYGKGGALAAVVSHLDTSSRKLALMETLGTNPEYMLRSLLAQEEVSFRESKAGGDITPADQAYLKKMESALSPGGKVNSWFAELTGEVNWVANPSLARAMSVARGAMSMSKLGGASLSAIADVFVKAMNMRVHGVSWPEAIVRSTAQYFKRYGAEEKMIARQIGAFTDAVAGEMRIRWDLNESMPGKMADLQDKFFRWSGLNWITESGKAGFAMWFSEHLGAVTRKTFDSLPADIRATLKVHGVDAKKWDLVRLMTQTGEDGKSMLVPSQADYIPDSALRSAYAPEFSALAERYKNDPATLAQAESNLMQRARRDLRTEVMGMISDETQYAIIEPDAKTRAFMRQGTRAGTLPGEFWRTIMQFKSFPIAYMQRQIGGKRWMRASLQEGMQTGMRGIGESVTRDIPGVIGASLSALSFGYLAMTAKDIAKGKMPRDPMKKETIFAALMQSGGAGIFGDFLFNKVDRFGNSFAGTVMGPLAGEAGRAITVAGQIIRGDLQSAGEDGLRLVLDNAPFVNLWQTREALNWHCCTT